MHCGEPLWDNGTVAVHLKLIIHEGKPTVLQTQWCDASKKTIGETALASVPTESRQPTFHDRLADTLCNVAQLLDGWHADGTAWSEWDESVRQQVSQFQGEVELIRKRNIPEAASSSLLPVPEEPILKLIERYEYEIGRGFWDVSQDGMRHILRDLKLLASLPVGESTRGWAIRASERIYLLYRDSNYFKSMPKQPLIEGWAEIMQQEFDGGVAPLMVQADLEHPRKDTGGESPSIELGLGESREPLPTVCLNCKHQKSEHYDYSCSGRFGKIECNCHTFIDPLPSVPAEIESVSRDVPKSSNETRNT